MFMTILPPALIGGADGAVWDFIYRFQGLITGILAVGAAFWTVVELRNSQRMQEQQHQAQIAVATLPHKLAILRFMALTTPILDNYPNICHQYLRQLDPALQWGENTNKGLANWLLATGFLKRLMHSDFFSECEPLFTPPVALCSQQIEASLEFFEAISSSTSHEIADLWKDELKPVWYHDGFGVAAEDLCKQVSELRRQLDLWFEVMLGERYQIAH
ncbi:hypothetical protein [Peteryoungia algae]|uniref:Uncharacterized protein n=1 Tax=Peteryoungia algae TaxID=2919917 RepID=A0ABT0D112_9HYPH|nr:hypothetical protein [Rhizobium sp. SSM4.3]MCJ8239070.1 hypothetical protein [Rhizobium sp. SSM4.3]